MAHVERLDGGKFVVATMAGKKLSKRPKTRKEAWRQYHAVRAAQLRRLYGFQKSEGGGL